MCLPETFCGCLYLFEYKVRGDCFHLFLNFDFFNGVYPVVFGDISRWVMNYSQD